MNKEKIIVNIDGPRGIGKSTQIGMLKAYFENKGLKVITDISDYPMDMKIHNSLGHLENEEDMVLSEGSFLRVLAEDFVNGVAQDKVLEKNRKLIELNEMTRHRYKVVNIIMYSEDTDLLAKRLTKFSKLTGVDVEVPDHKKEADILKQMVGFESSMITLNANTILTYIDAKSSMLEVRDQLAEVITSFLQSSF